jgi:hypothetical protein
LHGFLDPTRYDHLGRPLGVLAPARLAAALLLTLQLFPAPLCSNADLIMTGGGEDGSDTLMCADGEITRICLPSDYMKFELPEDAMANVVSIGVDIKDIPKVNDRDFSITLNAYFIVKWKDARLIVTARNRTSRTGQQLMQEARNPTSSTTGSSFLNY